jgi:hypothetical protein
MTTTAPGNADPTGSRNLLAAALTYWLVRLEDMARPAPNEINTIYRPAIRCRSPL